MILIIEFINLEIIQASTIKERYKVKEKLSFRLATTEEITAINRYLPTNKAVGGEVPVNVLKKSNFSFDELIICVNYALINGRFPITLKNANVKPVHNELDNSGLVGTILMDLSKAYDCLPHDLINAKFEAYFYYWTI